MPQLPKIPTPRGPRLLPGADVVVVPKVVLLPPMVTTKVATEEAAEVADPKLLARLPTLPKAKRRLRVSVATTVAVRIRAVAVKRESKIRTAGSTSITIWSASSTPR